MAKLPPRVVGVKSKQPTSSAKTGEKSKTVEAAEGQTSSSRSFGIRMMIFGAVAMVLPFFGLQLRQLGDAGRFTPLVGIILLVIGAISFFVSKSEKSANAATLGVKTVMWGIIGFMVLILVVGGGSLLVFVIAQRV